LPFCRYERVEALLEVRSEEFAGRNDSTAAIRPFAKGTLVFDTVHIA
jgi:hypothetical protein